MSRLLTNIDPAPAGFELVELTKRDLLAQPVGVLVADIEDLSRVLDRYTERVLGIVITLGEAYRLEEKSALLWHVTIPPSWIAVVGALAQGWLRTIGSADRANQLLNASQLGTERLRRELELTRHDYNELTERLQSQVRELVAAKDALSSMNSQLEFRVTERTVPLERANMKLSLVVDNLKRTKDELGRLAEVVGLGSLVAGVAHELNTPIGTALTVTTTLADESRKLHAEFQGGVLKRSHVEHFLRAAEEMTALLERNIFVAADIVNRLKQLANDQATESPRHFKLHETVADTLKVMDSQLRELPYKIRLELDASIEMNSYPGAISLILTNLITNAIRHAFDGRKEGVVTIRTAMHDTNTVNLSIADDGNGIPASQIERVFHPFFSTKFGQGGSGLGLYVAYNKAKKILGGKLTVTSELHHGARFMLEMPRVAPQRDRSAVELAPATMPLRL